METLSAAPTSLARLANMASDVGDEETAEWYSWAADAARHVPVAPRTAAKHPQPALVGLVVAALLLVACGGTTVGDPEARSGSASGGEEAASSAFPVTIEHKFGATAIAEVPERVLSLGFQEHDTVFALGVDPVAVRYWYGDESDVIFPWAEESAAMPTPRS